MNKLKIKIPQNFSNEREYIIYVIFHEFLGIDYHLESHEKPDYHIGEDIVVRDHFFSRIKNSYQSQKFIPENIQWFESEDDGTIPVIFGDAAIKEDSEMITCDIDIFASSFFMLTRWEEYVIPERDIHQRFRAQQSLALKKSFHRKPVVDQYVELLYRLLKKRIPGIKKRERSFQIIATHDIDHLRKWDSIAKIRKGLAHSLLTKKNIPFFLADIKSIASSGRDPYNTFNFIMNHSEKAGIKANFFLMAGGETNYDENYNLNSRDFKSLVDEIKSREHIIGFHPSYNTYANPELWRKEKNCLQEMTQNEIKSGRQHYLRFANPETWRIWEDNNMETDMTLGYAELPGFRCGTCHEFTVFDVVNSRTLKLKENPLLLMDTSLIHYQKLLPEEAWQTAKDIFTITKKYNGNFTFLWHNTELFTPEASPYRMIYTDILKGFK